MNSYPVIAGDDIKASEYNNVRDDMPKIGTIILWGKTTPPTDWLLCNGQSLDTTTYSDLFAVIGYTFGGAGANFNVPDLRERFPIGKSVTYPIGDTSGGTISLSSDNLPAHIHTITVEGPHTHNIKGGIGGGATQILGINATDGGALTTYVGTSDHNHGGTTGSTGSGTAVTILPEYLALNYIIKY